MNETELYSLKGKFLSFNDFEEFRKKIGDFFDKNLDFPVVVGYEKIFNHEQNWKIKNLSPLENSDRLTIQNFFGGLEEISEEENRNIISCIPIQFKGSIHYEGLETLNYRNWNSSILLASVNFANSQEYFLTLTFLGNDSKRGYHAKSGSFETTYDKIMKRYLGPNQK
jgi:hypothetical protein